MEAGLPAGVLNIVHGTGPGCGQAIVEHPGIKAISFTGGTATGRHLAATAAPMFKKLSLELGGKNPNLMFRRLRPGRRRGAPASAAASPTRARFASAARASSSSGPSTKQFKAGVSEAAPWTRKSATRSKPTPNRERIGKRSAFAQRCWPTSSWPTPKAAPCWPAGTAPPCPAAAPKATFWSPPCSKTWPYDCRTNQEEIFGPVVTLTPFDTEEEALAHGQQHRLRPVGHHLDPRPCSGPTAWPTSCTAGIVWVNTWLHRDLRTPFGGMKNSGVGREGGLEALRFFTEAQNVCVKL